MDTLLSKSRLKANSDVGGERQVNSLSAQVELVKQGEQLFTNHPKLQSCRLNSFKLGSRENCFETLETVAV